MKSNHGFWLLAGCMLLPPGLGEAFGDEIYKWTDAEGRVHYGSRAPAGVSAESKSIPTNSPDADQALTERRERQRRLLESYDYERGREAELAERERRQDRERAKRCRKIERHLRQLDHPGPVYVTGADGKRRYLDDAEREQRKIEMQPAYRRACGPGD